MENNNTNGATNKALETYVNGTDFPIQKRESYGYRALMERVQSDLMRDGCAVLKGFIKSEWHSVLEQEGQMVAPDAYFQTETVNAYNVPLDADLPQDHPAKVTMQRENAFVARDKIPFRHIIHQLFENERLAEFLSDCFGYEQLYKLADPLAGLCLNVLKPGCVHPWHYDVNEFTVSLLTKKPEAGGLFRYCPGIRSPRNENLSEVRQILEGGERKDPRIKELDLDVGDLQLFQGRYSLHQVSAVKGQTERHTAIFAYTLAPNVIGGTVRTMQLFGRTLPEHEAFEHKKNRADNLLD